MNEPSVEEPDVNESTRPARPPAARGTPTTPTKAARRPRREESTGRWLLRLLRNAALFAVGGTLVLFILRFAGTTTPPGVVPRTAPAAGDTAGIYRHAPAVVFGIPRLGPALVRPPLRIIPPIVLPLRKPALLRTPVERARGGEKVTVMVTAYCLKGYTRLDHYVREGIVAVDPRYFPLGREMDLHVGSWFNGRYRIDDTGKAIKGLRIDVWVPTCAEARRFGRRFGTARLVER